MKKAIVSWSGGKDSCLAAYRAIQEGFEIAGLFNTISDEYERVRFHGIEKKLIYTQAQALRIPLHQKITRAKEYTEDYVAGLNEALNSKEGQAIEYYITGDIHLASCRQLSEEIAKKTNLKPAFPLWGEKPENLLKEFIDLGFVAYITGDMDMLGKKYIGRKLDYAFIEEAKELGIDVCGENGEYHTLVTDGPLFHQKIELLRVKPVQILGKWFLDTMEYELKSKKPKKI